MLEAENRVLRLKGEQDKAHIAASQMLAKDLAAANGSGSPSARSGAASSDSSLQQLSDARGALERERKASKTKIDQLQAQIRELHACRSTDDAATSLGGEQAVAELQIKLRNAAEAHSKELEVARAAYAELATKLDQRTAAAAELQATVDAKSSEVDALSERLEHRSSELKRAMQRYHELVEEREQKHGGEPPEELEQIPVLEKQVEKLRRELADSESQRLTLAADLESAVGAQAAAEAVAAAMQSKVEQAGLAAAGHDQALTLLADCRSWSLQLIEALAKSAGDDASDDSYSGAAGSDPLQVLPGLFEQSQLLATRLADRLSDATQRAAALAADVQAKDEAISGLQAGADTCSGAQAGSSQPGRSEQIEELERQNAALIAERDEFNRENGMLTDYLGKLESECNRLVDDIEQLNSENQKLAEELRVASLQNSTVSLDIGALDGNAFGEIPDASMDDLRQRYTHEMAALKLQMDELQKRKDKEISSLQDEIASLEAMVEDKVFGESDLNDQIASLTSELNRLRIGQANAPRAGPSASPASADATAAAAVADDGTVYCEICESSDHDIADCPAVTSTATMFKQEASIDSSRPYCDNCEVFSHWTESCPHGDEMF
ncbi:hypothetical protein LPJ70_000162 [Coemansia sp. RSA 2708]|nr:hypothetical protein LPJ70_000162 [Coemansia sp. RSA 2708]